MIGSMLTKKTKSTIIKGEQRHAKDTGSTEVQIVVLTRTMAELQDHLKKNPKDNHSRRGLLKMVSQRRRLLSYLKRTEPDTYAKVTKKLEIK